jgi:hypothetical protein
LVGLGADYDDMASPHRSESLFQDGLASPLISLVPSGDGDPFEVVLGPVLTLVRSGEVSPRQEGLLTTEPMDDEPLLIEGGPPHVSISPDGQPLMTADVAADYDYELDESWLEEQLFDSPETEVPTSEGLAEAHASPGTFYFLCHLFVFCSSMHLCILFYFVAGSSAPVGPLEVTDIPILDPVPPVSGDEAIG